MKKQSFKKSSLIIFTLCTLFLSMVGSAQAATNSAGQWTWVDGSDTVNQAGTYGTEDIEAASNVPGARQDPSTWTDASGNLWLFGGFDGGPKNDLWMFDPSTGNWTWVDGSTTYNQAGTYSTEDVDSASNVPGARGYSYSWIDVSGNLWFFGGYGYDYAGNIGRLNDL